MALFLQLIYVLWWRATSAREIMQMFLISIMPILAPGVFSFWFLWSKIAPLLSAARFVQCKLGMYSKENYKNLNTQNPAATILSHKYLPACVSRLSEKIFSEYCVAGSPERFS